MRNFNVAGRRATALFFQFSRVYSQPLVIRVYPGSFLYITSFFLAFINLLLSSNYRDTPQLNEFIQTADYLLPTPPSHGAP